MYKGKKIILFAFGSDDLKKSADRLRSQSIKSKYYDDIKIFNSKNFDENMKKKFTYITTDRNKRGYGYWFWKPLFLQKIMKEINEGDIIHYVDIGCHIQNKNSRFNEYLELIDKLNIWILPFQYHLNHVQYPNEISFQNRQEYKYTKADLLHHFGFLNNKNITHTPQYWTGTFFLIKKLKSENFLNEWIDIFEKKFHLIDDSNSKIKNLDGFIENRHDQSVFSLLCKKYNLKSLSAFECEWGEKNNQRTWEHNFNNPILAKRDLKYGLFKRFINRQIRTFKRYRKKYFEL